MAANFNQPKEQDSVRLDRWLWSVRICKTRKDAADLCKRGRVSVDGLKAKPSRDIRPGQKVTVSREGIDWVYRVLKCIEKRISAKVAAKCREDLTPEEEVEKLRIIKRGRTPSRPKGMGRPTKKDRRALKKLRGY